MSRKLTGIVAAGVVVACLPLLWAGPRGAGAASQAKTETYKVDNVHTSVLFKIKHMEVADFYGRFNTVSGEFSINANQPSENALDIRVKVADIDTNNSERDKHLKAEEYFHAEKHAEIRFVGRKFKPMGTRKFEVTGDLTLRGVTKPLTIMIEHSKSVEDPWGNTRVGLATEFTIKRSDFGMTEMIGPLSDEVTLIVSLEGLRQ
jgi:polyisoprenoid-binding protein YceI